MHLKNRCFTVVSGNDRLDCLYVCESLNQDQVSASFAGAFTVAFVSHIMSKKFKMPMIIFSVAGIIPLVPEDWLIMPCEILWKKIMH